MSQLSSRREGPAGRRGEAICGGGAGQLQPHEIRLRSSWHEPSWHVFPLGPRPPPPPYLLALFLLRFLPESVSLRSRRRFFLSVHGTHMHITQGGTDVAVPTLLHRGSGQYLALVGDTRSQLRSTCRPPRWYSCATVNKEGNAFSFRSNGFYLLRGIDTPFDPR